MALVNFDTTNKGKRVELVYTNDPYTSLKPGVKGTYEGCLKQPDGRHQHCIRWDDGSLLMMIEGVDRFNFIAKKKTISKGCRI